MGTSTSGATIRYTTNGTTPTTSSPKFDVAYWPITTQTDTWFVAKAWKSGWNTSANSKTTYVWVGSTKAPSITQVNTDSGAMVRITDSNGTGSNGKPGMILYTTDGSNPAYSVERRGGKVKNGTVYTGEFRVTKDTQVKAMTVFWGKKLSPVTSFNVKASAPAQPKVTVEQNKIAVKDAIKLSWDKDASAASYTIKLYKDGTAISSAVTENAVADIVLNEAGDYEIGVTAKNFAGSSKESELVSVSAMPDCKVRFIDEHAEDPSLGVEVINEQMVRYGYSATKVDSPKKRGYSFAGWEGLQSKITSDTDIKSTWDINKYLVQFYAQDGTTQLSRQTVKYLDAADTPEVPAPATGYVFSGWQVISADDDSARDYKKVDSNLKLRAVYAWADNELPNAVAITSATRTAEGIYNVSVKVANYPYESTTALLRVALKTKDDKLVQTARETVSIAKDGTLERTITLKYTGDYIATVAEVEIVGIDGNYRTGGAFSKAVTAPITTGDGFSYSAWTDWSTTKPTESDTVQVEQGTQYRCRDKQTTTSTATSLDGWTRDGTQTTSYGAWSGNKTTTTKPTASDTLQIVSSKVTKYNYYHWHSKYDNCMNQDSCWVNSTSVKHTLSTTSPLSGPKYVFADKGGKASYEYGPGGTCAWNPSKAYWWLESTVTTYTYQTRTKAINYGYYKWDDDSWTDWSNEAMTATNNRQVETRTVWRSRTKQNTAGVEDTSGTRYDVSGKIAVDANLSGKEATIMVYNATNTDPNEDQLQYIGQTVLGEDNSYDFSFIPKKELSAESGDLIVALGVKGSTGLVNVDVIKAPRATHKVTFQYVIEDQSLPVIVSEQEVADGDNAVVPRAPLRAGYRFVGWDDTAQRVNVPLTVTAQFERETYTVAWVNWASDDIMLQNCEYGEELVAPESIDTPDGMTFKGWDALMDGDTTVTGNMIVNAVFETRAFKVDFVDDSGKNVETQQVEYGESAELPATQPTSPGKTFVGWSTSEDAPWWNVKSDLTVGALFAYEDTVDSPNIVFDEPTSEAIENHDDNGTLYVGPSGATLQLESATDGATIYYTTDGSEPVVPGTNAQIPDDEGTADVGETLLYDPSVGIIVTTRTRIRTMAVMDDMNDSCETDAVIDIEATNDIAYADAAIADATWFAGDPVEPEVGVWFGDEILEPGVDFTATYSNNDRVGTATVLVEGIGKYTGSQTLEFEITADTPAADPSSGRFTDVDYETPAWYAQAADYVADIGLMTGYDDGTFGVGKTLTRAELAVMMWRFDEPDAAAAYDKTTAVNETGMSDVKAGQWYTDAANWAVAHKVINGKTKNGKRYFEPGGKVTFEQLIVVLANYIDPDVSSTYDASSLWVFKDSKDVSSWAKSQLAWGYAAGLFSGNANRDGTRSILPKQNVARERTATVFMNAIESGVLAKSEEPEEHSGIVLDSVSPEQESAQDADTATTADEHEMTQV